VLAAGVRIVGDLDRLRVPAGDPTDEMAPPPTTVPIGVSIEAMAAMVAGLPKPTPGDD
jgi:hypothetical protein